MDVVGVQGLFVAVSIARWFCCKVSYHGTKPRALGKVCAVHGGSHWTEARWWHSNSALRWICWSCSYTDTSFTSTPCWTCRELFFMEPIFFMECIFIPMDNPQDTCKGWEWWEWRGMAWRSQSIFMIPNDAPDPQSITGTGNSLVWVAGQKVFELQAKTFWLWRVKG